jgi:ergothioneine biosynthesis protein EgtB
MLAVQPRADSYDRLLKRVDRARAQTDKLFDIVRTDSLYDRPIPERHRIVFYIGHLEAFDSNLVRSAAPGLNASNLTASDSDLDRLFAFGIDPVDGGLPTDQPSDWPPLPQVRQYAARTRAAVDAVLQEGGVSETLLHTAIEHRLMHAETLAYMLHQMPLEKKNPQAQPEVLELRPLQPEMLRIPAGPVTLGLSRKAPDFGWDNEYEAQTVEVNGFSIDRYKVTNSQYLAFVRAGGYHTRKLWTDADWDWKNARDISHPVFWKPTGRDWHLRAMFGEVPLPASWPVYVSHAEAAAYARWIGKRLPTEAEWQRAAQGVPPETTLGPEHGYFDFVRWDPFPVNAFPAASSAFEVDGLLANGWEWTSTVFAPFPGFQAFPFYEGYSANFFDGKHYVMKGGSTRTEKCMLRPTFRNWFQPHYQYVYAGFRCAGE